MASYYNLALNILQPNSIGPCVRVRASTVCVVRGNTYDKYCAIQYRSAALQRSSLKLTFSFRESFRINCVCPNVVGTRKRILFLNIGR